MFIRELKSNEIMLPAFYFLLESNSIPLVSVLRISVGMPVAWHGTQNFLMQICQLAHLFIKTLWNISRNVDNSGSHVKPLQKVVSPSSVFP